MASIIQSNIMGRQLKIFTIRLLKNNPEIIPDPTLEYLRYDKMIQISRFFTRTFISYADHILCRLQELMDERGRGHNLIDYFMLNTGTGTVTYGIRRHIASRRYLR